MEDRAQLADLEKAIVAIKPSTREKVVDPSTECTLWRKEVVELVQARIGRTIDWGDTTRELTGPFINAVIKAHGIPSPSAMYYRPLREGSRAMYGEALVDWIVEEYAKDPQFFYKAHYGDRQGEISTTEEQQEAQE